MEAEQEAGMVTEPETRTVVGTEAHTVAEPRSLLNCGVGGLVVWIR